MFLTEVPYRRNGKSAVFFDDHVEFGGQSIRYDEIETLTTNGRTTIHTFIGIPVGRSFDGGVQFKMNNGKTAKIIMSAWTLFGIPVIWPRRPRTSEKLYPPMFDAVYSIVARHMAQKYIYWIQGGATVEVAGFTINSSGATTKAKLSKNITTINKENYSTCQIKNDYGIAVFDKHGDMLWQTFWGSSYKNVLLIPYIFEVIFT